MSRLRTGAELLPIMAAAFPKTFFVDSKQVQPIKIGIHEDLLAALPAEIRPTELKRFLHGYVNRMAYLKALLHGQGRIDLTGAVVDGEIPAEIRERARESWLQLRAARQNPKPARARSAAQPGPPRPAAPATAINPEELYAMAIDAKLEVTLKFSTLPNARPAGQGKMAFALKTPDGQFVTVEVSNKAWNKLISANTDWPSWVAALTGSMGERTEKGFTLANPGLQVFERKPKAPAEAASPLAEASSAALAAISSVEPAPAPAVADPVGPASVPPAAATAEPDSASRKPVLSLKSRKATP